MIWLFVPALLWFFLAWLEDRHDRGKKGRP